MSADSVSALGVHDKENSGLLGHADDHETIRLISVRGVERARIAEDRRLLMEGDAMLRLIGACLGVVPLKVSKSNRRRQERKDLTGSCSTVFKTRSLYRAVASETMGDRQVGGLVGVGVAARSAANQTMTSPVRVWLMCPR